MILPFRGGTGSKLVGGIDTQEQSGVEPKTKRKPLHIVSMQDGDETLTQKIPVEGNSKSTVTDMPPLNSEGLSYSQLLSNRQQSVDRVNQTVTDFENMLGGYGAKPDNIADVLAIKYGGTVDENGRQVFETQEGLDAFRKEYRQRCCFRMRLHFQMPEKPPSAPRSPLRSIPRGSATS